jgi:hypothetical protein
MGSFFKLVLLLLLTVSHAYGAAPAFNQIDNKKYPLKITLEDGVKLKFAGTVGGDPIKELHGGQSSDLVRVGYYNNEFTHVFVSEDLNLAPLIIVSKKTQPKLHIKKSSFQKIGPQETWLWGMTQESNCPAVHGNPNVINYASYKVDHRHENKYTTNSIKGAFAINVKLAKKPKVSTLYFMTTHHDLGVSAQSKGVLVEADDVTKSLCFAKYGAKCENIFLLNEKKFGEHHQVKFDKALLSKLKKFQINCPV